VDASVKEWAATDGAFLERPDAASTAYVPGHGGMADRNDVADFRGFLVDLQRLVAEGRRAGLSGDALAQAVSPKLRARHPDWTITDRAAASEVRYMDQELGGTKRRPIPQPD
jgi:hypothetical protein